MSFPLSNFKPAKRRVIIVDHMCALPYGHNVGSVELYRRVFSPFFEETLCLVSKQLPGKIAQAKNFRAELYYPYNTDIPVKYGSWVKTFFKKPLAFRDAQRLLRSWERNLLFLSNDLRGKDVLLPKVVRNWQRLIETHQIGSDDLIFFPSSDYYGAITLLEILSKRKKNLPEVHCRFIGVMENASHHTRIARARLLRAIQQAEKSGVRISASAEVPIYARYLTEMLRKEVFAFFYPLAGEKIPMPRGAPFIASSIGQGRTDKGHFEMAGIAQALQDKVGSKVILEIQDMGKNQDEYKYSYERKLEVFPNIRLFKAVLQDEEIREMFQRACVVLAPYDPSTYRLRGSAIFQEAVAYGRPVITRKGVGFTELVEKYNCGYVCTTHKEIAEAIQNCMLISPEIWETRLEKARESYAADFQAGLETFMRLHA